MSEAASVQLPQNCRSREYARFLKSSVTNDYSRRNERDDHGGACGRLIVWSCRHPAGAVLRQRAGQTSLRPFTPAPSG